MMNSKWPLVREKCGVKCTFPTLAEWADDWTAEAKIEAIVQQNARETQRFKEKLKFSEGEQFGSRAVGGQKPLDEGHYSLIQSSDYLPPDTAEEEAYHRSFTPAMRTRRHMFVWLLYAFLAVVVAVVVLAVEHACAVILNARVEATDYTGGALPGGSVRWRNVGSFEGQGFDLVARVHSMPSLYSERVAVGGASQL